MINPSTDQALSPYKSHIRNYKKIKPHTISTSSDCGLKPYFLPLPTSNSHNNTVSRRGIRMPPQKGSLSDHVQTTAYQKHRNVNRKTKYNGMRDQNPSHTFKKSRQSTNSPTSQCLIKLPWGPNPKDLPKHVAKFVSINNIISTTDSVCSLEAVENQVDRFSGSVVSILSPPPSSLPLPTFSLRPKLSCSAEAAGVDIGATNNLRRLLRLQ